MGIVSAVAALTLASQDKEVSKQEMSELEVFQTAFHSGARCLCRCASCSYRLHAVTGVPPVCLP